MDILGTLLGSAQGGALEQAAQQFGLKSSDSQRLLKALVPALAGGITQNATKPGGMAKLTQALSTGNHQRYVDEPAALRDPGAVDDGNAILGHLLGSKDVSRRVADEAATATGVDAGVIKKFLPLIAAAAMGALSKQTAAGADLEKAGAGGALGALAGLFGSGGGAEVAGKLLALGKKFF
jgi:hypothetical protein